MRHRRWRLRPTGTALLLATAIALILAVVTNSTAIYGVLIVLVFVWAVIGLRATSPTMRRFGGTSDPGSSAESLRWRRTRR